MAWSANALNGRIAFKAQRAVFAPWLMVNRLTGVVQFNGPEIVFEDIAGGFGKGRFDGRLAVSNGAGRGDSADSRRRGRRRAWRDLCQRRPPGNVWPFDIED